MTEVNILVSRTEKQSKVTTNFGEGVSSSEQERRNRLVEILTTTGIDVQMPIKQRMGGFISKTQVVKRVNFKALVGSVGTDMVIHVEDVKDTVGRIITVNQGLRSELRDKSILDTYRKNGIISIAQSLIAEVLISQQRFILFGSIAKRNVDSIRSRFLIRALLKGDYYLTHEPKTDPAHIDRYLVETSLRQTTKEPLKNYPKNN
jgi:glycerol-3-phosphate O-acyltransferase